MVLYIRHELSYDNFQAKGNRIARMIMEYSVGGATMKGNFTSTKVAPVFKKTFPEVEEAVRMTKTSRVVQFDDKQFNEKSFAFADSTFFDLFSFKLLRGDKRTALSGTEKVIFTEAAAKKYFGTSDPVGKIVKVGSELTPYEVTGVIEDCPSNSQIKFDFLASFSSLYANQVETYYDANYTTYLLLKSPKALRTLKPKISPFMKSEMKGELTGNDYLTFDLEPFSGIHLHSPYEGFEPNNSITYIYMVGAIALLILAIACFTYINLSTARSLERAKEVGIRKVSGAQRGQIFWQFIGESAIVSLLAFIISIFLAYLLLPSFSRLADKQLAASLLFTPGTLLFALLILICVTLLGGSYPALILSRFQPVKVLKGAFKNRGSALLLRKSLTVFQFVISVFLLVATFTIQDQIHYIRSKDLGYNKDHVIVFPLDSKMKSELEVLKTEFKKDRDVLSAAEVSNKPVEITSGYSMSTPEQGKDARIAVNANVVDDEFIETIGARIVAGSDFSRQDLKDVASDSLGDRRYHYILNESAAKVLGWTPAQAIGKKMFLGEQRPGTVRGVVKDFHFASLHDPIKPLVLFNESWSRYLLIKVKGQHLPQTISFLETKWKELVPHRPFEYSFLDEDYDRLYTAEIRLGKVLNIFAGIAILLACLGLVGLSAYAIHQRTKEIGIRKVLGATASNLLGLLSKDFVILSIVAMAIAFPLAAWLMSRWLQDFAYRVVISWWIFGLAGLLLVLVTLISISFQALKAAFANPVKSLRIE